jgi:hypothetical protein
MLVDTHTCTHRRDETTTATVELPVRVKKFRSIHRESVKSQSIRSVKSNMLCASHATTAQMHQQRQPARAQRLMFAPKLRKRPTLGLPECIAPPQRACMFHVGWPSQATRRVPATSNASTSCSAFSAVLEVAPSRSQLRTPRTNPAQHQCPQEAHTLQPEPLL